MKRAVEAICVGQARPFKGSETSAIAKIPAQGVLKIDREGFLADEQADRRVHGGPEMALHLYPLDHHDFWCGALADHAVLDSPGAFGSNLAVRNIAETQVFIGDRFRLGSALLEVSQPRQPCWKIEHRFGHAGMVATIVETGFCGWYFRVLEEGSAQAGDTIERVESGHEGWSVRRVFHTLFGPNPSSEDLWAVSALDRLSPRHKERALKLLA